MTLVRPPPSAWRSFRRQVKEWTLLACIVLACLAIVAWLTVLPSAGLLWLCGAF